MRTVRSILSQARSRLARSDSPSLDAEVVLAFVLKKSREYLAANPDLQPLPAQSTEFNKLVSRRAKGEPVAYLTGHKEFFGLDFKVNKHVLIPRPETELLVERALASFPPQDLGRDQGRGRKFSIIDLGTGSGCIAISLAKTLQQMVYSRLVYNTLRIYAIDSSTKALAIARQNAKTHGVLNKIKFLKGDLLSPILNSKFLLLDSIILANLPYLTPRQYDANPELRFEPKSALVGGPDGLKYYEMLFKQLTAYLRHGEALRSNLINTGIALSSTPRNYRNRIILLLEIDPAQKNKIKSLGKKYFPRADINFYHDLSARARVCEIFVGDAILNHGR